MRRALAFALLAAAALPAAAQTTATTGPLDRAVAAYRDVRSMRASFDQTLTNPVTSRASSAKGELLVKRPGKIAVTFTAPAGDRIVSDGSQLWIYLPSSAPGQVIHTTAAAEGMGLDVSTELLTAPRAKFDVTESGSATVDGRATHMVRLVPRTPRNYRNAVLWIDDANGLVRQLQLEEQSGVTRLITFRSIQLNAPIPASAFKFAVPKGAKVYDGNS